MPDKTVLVYATCAHQSFLWHLLCRPLNRHIGEQVEKDYQLTAQCIAQTASIPILPSTNLVFWTVLRPCPCHMQYIWALVAQQVLTSVRRRLHHSIGLLQGSFPRMRQICLLPSRNSRTLLKCHAPSQPPLVFSRGNRQQGRTTTLLGSLPSKATALGSALSPFINNFKSFTRSVLALFTYPCTCSGSLSTTVPFDAPRKCHAYRDILLVVGQYNCPGDDNPRALDFRYRQDFSEGAAGVAK
ncbi:hypothetical protein AB1N83_001598 [Pleurotus pulmonarius]